MFNSVLTPELLIRFSPTARKQVEELCNCVALCVKEDIQVTPYRMDEQTLKQISSEIIINLLLERD